jgi:hypothetical protein
MPILGYMSTNEWLILLLIVLVLFWRITLARARALDWRSAHGVPSRRTHRGRG